MQYLYAIMLIGYARVSTGEQTTAAQVAALKTSGCELIFRDNASGGRWDRPELHKLLSQLRKGDVLVVWTLDRLSRSLRDVLTIMERVQERHAGFRSLKEVAAAPGGPFAGRVRLTGKLARKQAAATAIAALPGGGRPSSHPSEASTSRRVIVRRESRTRCLGRGDHGRLRLSTTTPSPPGPSRTGSLLQIACNGTSLRSCSGGVVRHHP